MRFLGFLSLLVILVTCIAAQPASADCSITLDSHCGGGNIGITWMINSSSECTGSVSKIERKCGSGAYTTVATGPFSGGGWTDFNVPGCVAGYTYRVTLVCECDGEPPVETTHEVVPPC